MELTPARASPGADGWAHRPHLDGLRTIAIYLVVAFHAGFSRFAGGFIGVDVFFVLSGFLVGSVIINEHHTTGRIRMTRFYARRVRRLLPAAVITVVGVSALSVIVQPRLTRERFIDDAQSALLYSANWHFLSDATNYFATDVDRSPFLHFWSLAIEEQFYVIFPLLLVGLFVLSTRLRRPSIVPIGLAVAMLASLTAQFVLAAGDPLRAYYGTDTRLYQLLAGTTLAAVLHRRRVATARTDGNASTLLGRLASWWAVLGAVAIVLVASSWFDTDTTWRGVAATISTVAVIVALEVAPRAALGRFLSSNPMTYLGRISYSTYLWHWPLIVLAVPVLDLSPWQRAAVGGIGGTALAALSFQLIESPIRTSKLVLRLPRSSISIGLTFSVVAALVVVPRILHDSSRPALAQRNVIPTAASSEAAAVDTAALDRALQAEPPVALDLAPTEMVPVDQSKCTGADPDGCVVHRGSGVHIMLLGDSNAEVLIPAFTALAEQHDFTFSVSTRLGCPWQLGLSWEAKDQRLIDNCESGRTTWYDDLLPALRPDIIVVVNVPRDPGSRPDAFFVPGDGAPANRSLNQVIADATAASLVRLTADGARVVILEPLPYANFDPVECLSGATTVADCSYQTPTVPYPTESIYRSEAIENSDVFSLDYDRIACPFLPTCVPMIDGELVFRNEFHLSNHWIMSHTDDLWAILTDSGAIPPS